MQKNRNRSVKNSFEFSTKFLESLPNVETIQASTKTNNGTGTSKVVEPVFLREEKTKTNSNRLATFSCDSLTNESDLDIVSFGKSSSSSISWSDDFDIEATARVQDEFERMERILQGKEPIPLHYNKDEYKQWINTFPQLSVIGNNIGRSSTGRKVTKESQCKHYEELIAHHSDNDYLTENVKSLSSSDLRKISCIKNQAVEEVFQKLSSKLTNATSVKATITTKNTKSVEYDPPNLFAPKSNRHLRASPFFSKESFKKTPTINKRQESSNSEKLSKWMQESSNKYSSLPYIKCAKNKVNKLSVRKKSSGNSRYSSNASPYKSNCVSLPPIKTLNAPSANQYRSISTTPRNPNKTIISSSIIAQSKNKKNIKYNLDVNKCEQGRN